MSKKLISALTSKPLIFLSVVACLAVPIILIIPPIPESKHAIMIWCMACVIALLVIRSSLQDFFAKHGLLARLSMLVPLALLVGYCAFTAS